MKTGVKICLATAAVSAVLLLAVACVFGLRWYADNRKPGFTRDFVLYVYPETSAYDVLDTLRRDGVAVDLKSLERAFEKEDVKHYIKPGRYVLEPSSPAIYAARMLTRGWQTPQNLTLSGTIRSKDKIASQISRQMMVTYEEVRDALDNPDFLADYGTDTVRLFGFFLPDTYQIYWTASLEEIFDRFRKEYDAFWTQERLDKARALGLSREQVSVLASIVAGETRAKEEYSKIAGVYLNRYYKGMKLQADPTVCYCYSYTLDRVLKKHLEIDSPYNTYRYAGLPPGPINVPYKDHIDAVLNPDRHGYIFFCASPAFDGTHRFAVTYEEHMRNAREFQRALDARVRKSAS